MGGVDPIDLGFPTLLPGLFSTQFWPYNFTAWLLRNYAGESTIMQLSYCHRCCHLILRLLGRRYPGPILATKYCCTMIQAWLFYCWCLLLVENTAAAAELRRLFICDRQLGSLRTSQPRASLVRRCTERSMSRGSFTSNLIYYSSPAMPTHSWKLPEIFDEAHRSFTQWRACCGSRIEVVWTTEYHYSLQIRQIQTQ